jgi:hypothetical protein
MRCLILRLIIVLENVFTAFSSSERFESQARCQDDDGQGDYETSTFQLNEPHTPPPHMSNGGQYKSDQPPAPRCPEDNKR